MENVNNPIPALAGSIVTDIVQTDSNQDGNISLFEIGQTASKIGFKSVMQLQGQSLEDITAAFKNPTPETIARWVEDFAATNDWADQESEDLAEDWMRWFAAGGGLLQRTVALRAARNQD